MFVLILFSLVISQVSAQTVFGYCDNAGKNGNCVNGTCPSSFVCVSDPPPNGTCCTNGHVVPYTTSTLPPTTPTTVSTLPTTTTVPTTTTIPTTTTTIPTTTTVTTTIPTTTTLPTVPTIPTVPTVPTVPTIPITFPTIPFTIPTSPATGSTILNTVTPTVMPTTPFPGICVDRVDPNTGVSGCPGMVSYCQNAVYYALMTAQCPLTCKRCNGTSIGLCADRVNPITGVSECPGMVSLCQNSVYYDLMTRECPKTCGRCTCFTTTSPGYSCADKVNPYTGVSDCPGMASYCQNSIYYDLMTRQCPKTCGRCGNSTTTVPGISCFDKLNPSTGVSDCPGMASYCQNTVYYDLMTAQCPKTCGRCGISTATASSTSCLDRLNPSTYVSDCPAMASYCQNSVYYDVMTVQCPKTCGRCNGSTTTTVVSSTSCADKVNPSTGVSDCSGMASYCQNTIYYDLMTSQCPKTCGRCGSITTTTTPGSLCVDKLNPLTGVSDCPGMASYCLNSVYYDLMTSQCPKTCGRCSCITTTTPGSTCADKRNPSTGVSDCPGMASYCQNSVYYDVMTIQCPKTCGRCGTTITPVPNTPCGVDKLNPSTGVSDCPAMSSYCQNSVYYDLMTNQCPRTCGRCNLTTATISGTVCVDLLNPSTGVSDCPGMASFCNDAVYYNVMTVQCPRTCGRCGLTATTSLGTSCVDILNPSTGVSDCPGMASFCNDAVYYNVMTVQCPRTCGRCGLTATTSSGTSCVDLLNPSTGVSDCPGMASFCNDAVYYNVMTAQCPRTCNRCRLTTTSASGTSCVDLLNPSTGVSDCPGMASFCNDAVYYNVMTVQCPRTCGRCGSTTTIAPGTTCVDLLNPTTGVSDCPGMASFCNDYVYYDVMTTQCPRTCGRCNLTTTSSSAASCVDLRNPSTGVSDCPGMASLCNDPVYYNVMTVQCPRTCSRCGITATTSLGSSCVDLLNPSTGVSDCPGMVSFCNDAVYYNVMTIQCPKTCGRCASTTTVATTACADLINPSTGVSDCPGMASDCTDPTYLTVMKQQCPKTCGYCTVG